MPNTTPAPGTTWAVEDAPFALIPHALIEDTELPHTAVRVYCYLMRRARNDTKEAFPGFRRIGKDIGMSTSTVSRGIKALETRGWIDVTRSTTDKGDSRVNHYFVRQTNGGVAKIETRVPKIDTGGVPKIDTELEPLLTRHSELDTPAARNWTWDWFIDNFELPAVTDTQKKRLGRVVREVDAALDNEGCLDGEARYMLIGRRVASWPKHFPDATLTPEAVAKWITQLGKPPLRMTDRDVTRLETHQALEDMRRTVEDMR